MTWRRAICLPVWAIAILGAATLSAGDISQQPAAESLRRGPWPGPCGTWKRLFLQFACHTTIPTGMPISATTATTRTTRPTRATASRTSAGCAR